LKHIEAPVGFSSQQGLSFFDIGGGTMTKEEKSRYSEPEALRDILKRVLSGRKFMLDCGHHVSFGHFLGNDITILNGKEPKIICSLCGH
jgi:hypothetical protein